ncbi:MAG: CHASE2 domain-containing protein [Nitrosomonas sp.]
MTKWFRQLLLGGMLGLFGILAHLMPLEERFGLFWLFHLRGPATAPDNVVGVAIDQTSAMQMGLSIMPRLWPRDIHAQLIDKLVHDGARAIVFDLVFDMPSVLAETDERLAQAIRAAGNVILTERLVRHNAAELLDHDRALSHLIIQEGSGQLLPVIADEATARAPFAVPKADRVNHYWTFKADAGDMPTVPVLALQFFSLPVYEDLIRLLRLVDPMIAEQLPSPERKIDVEDVVLKLRHIFWGHPQLVQHIYVQLNRDSALSVAKKKMLAALINLYASHDKHYLNFYGPPRSITTVPYYQVLDPGGYPVERSESPRVDFKDKVVFVGFSGATQPEQDIVRDDYHTVFSNPDGLFISGVEIAATAFANLLENRPVRPLPLQGSLGILFLLGFTAGMAFMLLSTRKAIAVGIVVLIMYVFSASYIFSETAIWIPVIIPVVQILLAFILSEILKHQSALKKSEQLETQLVEIRRSLGSSYPSKAIEQLLGNHQEQGIFSPCLTTDVAGYTTLSELIDSKDLGELISNYRNALKDPIRQHKGQIMDMIADSMLAIWINQPEHSLLRSQACHAALDLAAAVERFNQLQSDHRLWLPTRIGLHCGEMSLRRGDGSYNVVGDVINTANRIQGANKFLNTHILLSGEVVDGLDEFLTRPLGKFLLPGKTLPVHLAELLSVRKFVSEEQLWLCGIFASSLQAYQSQRWDEASGGFKEILRLFPADGPSRFFLTLCERYRDTQPLPPWPMCRIETK